MLKRLTTGAGKAFRESGQALDRMGMRAQDNWAFKEKICRHRAIMNLFDQRPDMGVGTFVAPNASVIGNVTIKQESSVWYGAVIRGDHSPVIVGGFTSIGDRTSVLSAAINPTGFAARTFIGDSVTIGQGCVLKGCTVEDNSNVGDGCIIQEGALVQKNARLEAGSVLAVGMCVPEGEVYAGNPAAFVRKVTADEIQDQSDNADNIVELAAAHNEEFLPYGTLYQNKEQLTN